MEISSTTSRPPVQTQQIERKQQVEQAQELQQRRAQEVRAQQAREEAAPPKPKPVVNTQGQTTGRLVNVTA